MKIISLQAENVKKLKAVEIKPNGEIVTIAGKNGAGKTSVLDSIWWALAGTSNIQAQPIRKGEKKARIRLDLGEMVVERKFTESGSTLSVESKDGARYPSPQKMLDALLGALSFDPLAFARMEPRKQFDELRRVSKLEVDIDALDALNKGDYAKRTDINRDAKAKRAQAEGIPTSEDKRSPVDETALIEALQKAGEQNTEIETRKSRRVAAQETANEKKREGTELFEQVAKMREQTDALDKRARVLLSEAAEIEKKIDAAAPIPTLVDVSLLRQKIEAARVTNKEIEELAQAKTRKDAAISEAVRLESDSKQLTEKMEAREKAKADAVASAKMPVDGLGFGAGTVTYCGVPFDQCSSAEQLRVSMSIAMAANPKLRVIRITDGSLLDEESLKALSLMAKDADYQVWIERVDSSGKVGIVIDDGAVVAVNEAE
jgi:DNA repair exonuclease SbcCD ATPase subunit